MKRTVLAFLLLLSSPALASNPDAPHPYEAVLTPITTAPVALELTTEEEERLRDGRTVQRYVRAEEDGWGVAVNLVSAPAEVVWDTILNYPRYSDWVDNVRSCTVYRREGTHLFVDMQMSIMGIRKGIYTDNDVRREQGWMSWHLDYSRQSDVADMVGYWRVEQIQQSPPVTRLDYSTQMAVRGAPEWLITLLTKSSLRDGTRWVKRRAEEAWQAR